MPVLTPSRRRLPLARLFLILLALGTVRPLAAQAGISKEYQVKAVFLFNLARFVQWPPAALSRPKQPFCVGILGDDPFGDFLDETLSGEKIGEHPMVVQRYSRVEDAEDCHILFISRSESGRLAEILGSLRGRSVLTVSDCGGFARNGGMIRLLTRENKIRFRINLKAVRDGQLSISSKLLRMAEIIGTEGD